MEGNDWGSWFQNVSQQWAGAYLGAKYQQPYEIERLRLQALGDLGPYIEGQNGVYRPGVGGVSPTVLLIGAAVLAVVLLRGD